MNYTAAITKSGHMFSFGRGSSSCLGHGNIEYQAEPVLVEALAGKAFKPASHMGPMGLLGYPCVLSIRYEIPLCPFAMKSLSVHLL